MPFDPDKHDRRSLRLPTWDYRRPAAYFVTICTHERVRLFGEVVEGRMQLNAYGRVVAEEWDRTEHVRDNVELDAFVVMPNHVHGIIGITANADHGGTAERDTGASTDEDAATRRRGTARRAPAGANRQFGQPQSGSLSTIVRAFKSAATRRINRRRNTPGAPVWQRNFWEWIIRDDRHLDNVRKYIRQNPARWHRDRNHPTGRRM